MIKCSLFFAFAISFMQGVSQPAALMLDSVVVRENRIQTPLAAHNRAIRIISSDEIRSLPVKSIPEVLAYAAGVDVRQRGPWGAQADISIDGSTFDQVVVLLNGVKMSDPQTGHNMMNLPLPLSAIDHIEVVRGAAAATYGVNALAGAINIVTKMPVSNTVTAQVYTGSALEKDTSNGHLYTGWGAQATAGFKTKSLSQLLSLSFDKSNGYRYNTDNQTFRLYHQAEAKIGEKVSLSTTVGYVDNNYGANFFYAAPTDKEATEHVQAFTGVVAVSYRPKPTWAITPRISWRYSKDDYIFVRQNPSLYHNIHETNVITTEVQASKTLSNGYVGFGLELRDESINSNNLGKHDRNNFGIFAEYRHFFTDKIKAGLGLYANQNTDYGFQMYPAADVGYSFAPHWKLSANGGISQRLPTFTDLYYVGPTNIGNATLKPELARFVGVGIKYSTTLQRIELQYTYRRIADFIDWVRNDVQSAWQPENFGTMNTNVISLSGELYLDAMLHLAKANHLRLFASWNYIDPNRAGVEKLISKYSTDALRHQVIAGIGTEFLHHFSATLGVRYLQRINSGDYTLADIHLQYKINDWQIFSDVNNLFDVQYSEINSVPLPGQWITLGLRLSMTY